MISVDGDRDTPQTMRDYLKTLSPDFIGLTGPVTDVRTIAGGFAATFFKDAPKTLRRRLSRSSTPPGSMRWIARAASAQSSTTPPWRLPARWSAPCSPSVSRVEKRKEPL